MDWTNLVGPAITVVIVVSGWYVLHRLTLSRDQRNKRRDLRTQFVLEAYRRLEHSGNRPLNQERAAALEKAVADIQLLGTVTQVELATDFALGFAQKKSHSLDPLLNDLRNDLRKELGLSEVSTGITYLRVSP